MAFMSICWAFATVALSKPNVQISDFIRFSLSSRARCDVHLYFVRSAGHFQLIRYKGYRCSVARQCREIVCIDSRYRGPISTARRDGEAAAVEIAHHERSHLAIREIAGE